VPFADATIDLHHLGRAEAVACRLLDTSAGPVLVDPGPASTMDTLHAELAARGVAPHDLHALLLTHIHFDHAGASGVLAQAHPGLTVYVHPAGAPHLAEPRRLVASATRIYGDAMDRLWGPILPVPEGQLRLLDDGSRLTLGDRAFAVQHTPGHAVHHAAFLDEGTGIAYVGDTAGIRSPAAPVALPVTPPPDFDLEAWLASLERLEGWSPAQLFITHFGIVDTPASHLSDIRNGLIAWTAQVRQLLLDSAIGEGEHAAHFHAWVLDSVRDLVPEPHRERLAAFADFRAGFHGIARYVGRRS
jgi:glyoxylase-like metal-dependent hydrolase (beta-lactamase superfamily II)